jgi:acyl-CoA thioester hydrolase
MIELARSSVQTWECDQMGHMNVQVYVEKASDALAAFGAAIGLGPRKLDHRGLALEPADTHIRFLKELRPGTPYYLRGGVAHAGIMALTAYSELVTTADDAVAATFRTIAHLRNRRDGDLDGFEDGVRAMAMHYPSEIPTHGAPRGLTMDAPRDPAPTLKEAAELGMIPTYEGVVRPADCDAHGEMLPRAFMARVSDAIPNLLVQTSGRDRSRETEIGGAALEYRFIYRRRPHPGDILAVRSGLRAVGGKTYHWVHWLFDVESGEAVATSEAVAVAMDLTTRKAIQLPDGLRARLDPLVIDGLSV